MGAESACCDGGHGVVHRVEIVHAHQSIGDDIGNAEADIDHDNPCRNLCGSGQGFFVAVCHFLSKKLHSANAEFRQHDHCHEDDSNAA